MNHDSRRMTAFTLALAILLSMFIRLMLGDVHDDIGPATVPTIILPGSIMTATPPYHVYAPVVD